MRAGKALVRSRSVWKISSRRQNKITCLALETRAINKAEETLLKSLDIL
jgi:hypothetical protein